MVEFRVRRATGGRGQWLADGSLDAVLEINHQCLDYLAAMATAGAPSCAALFAGQGPVWREMPAALRLRLAASPYLLADAAFDDEARWRCLAPRMVQGPAAPVHRTRVRRARRQRFHPPCAGVRLAPGARQSPAGARGAGHVTGLRRLHLGVATAGSGLAGAASARVGASALGAPAPHLAAPVAGGARSGWRASDPGQPAWLAADGSRSAGPQPGGRGVYSPLPHLWRRTKGRSWSSRRSPAKAWVWRRCWLRCWPQLQARSRHPSASLRCRSPSRNTFSTRPNSTACKSSWLRRG